MGERTCEGCGQPINLLRDGARACSARCRKRISRRPALPEVMTSRRRWVRWRLVERNGKATKLPIQLNGRNASSTDPATWTTHAEAVRSNLGSGLGFVLGDGIGCWDFDHCISGGKLAGWAREVIEGIADPLLIEVSQSGEGVHVFVGSPEGPGRKIRDGERNIEFYSMGRYIAVTGNRLTL